jgi:hypothetical protein
MAVADDTKNVIELLSGLLHPRVADALAGFLPGLFFESSVWLASPQRVRLLLADARLDRPTEVFLVFLLALVMGNAFMFWVRFIQSFLRTVFGTFHRWWPVLLERRLVISANQRHLQATRKLPTGQQPPRGSLYFRLVHWAFGREISRRENRHFIEQAWGEVATTLLKRYGVEHPRRGLGAWTNVLGAMRAEELRGFPLIASLHATGWAGLSAGYFAPELLTRPFKGLCWFLIFCGLLHGLSLASWTTHPVKSWVMGLRNTWEELKAVGPTVEKQPPSSQNDQPQT